MIFVDISITDVWASRWRKKSSSQFDRCSIVPILSSFRCNHVLFNKYITIMALAISKKRKVINENQCVFNVRMGNGIASLIENNRVHQIDCVTSWEKCWRKKNKPSVPLDGGVDVWSCVHYSACTHIYIRIDAIDYTKWWKCRCQWEHSGQIMHINN